VRPGRHHFGRRVSRATSWADKRSLMAGRGSLTHGGSTTETPGAFSSTFMSELPHMFGRVVTD
jgi:hypothetical protein